MKAYIRSATVIKPHVYSDGYNDSDTANAYLRLLAGRMVHGLTLWTVVKKGDIEYCIAERYLPSRWAYWNPFNQIPFVNRTPRFLEFPALFDSLIP